jgi:hypothetical protein
MKEFLFAKSSGELAPVCVAAVTFATIHCTEDYRMSNKSHHNSVDDLNRFIRKPLKDYNLKYFSRHFLYPNLSVLW